MRFLQRQIAAEKEEDKVFSEATDKDFEISGRETW
jgi:hypothetical protein